LFPHQIVHENPNVTSIVEVQAIATILVDGQLALA